MNRAIPISTLLAGCLFALAVLTTASASARPSAQEIERTRVMIYKIAAEEGIDGRILDAIVEIESGYNNKLRGKAGEYGAAQVMPSVWAKEFGIPPHWLADLENNLRAGAKVIKRCRARWRDEFSHLGKVHPGLKQNKVTVRPEVFTAGCYNFGGLAGRLRKTPKKRWNRVSIPKGTLRYMTRFSHRYGTRPPPPGARTTASQTRTGTPARKDPVSHPTSSGQGNGKPASPGRTKGDGASSARAKGAPASSTPPSTRPASSGATSARRAPQPRREPSHRATGPMSRKPTAGNADEWVRLVTVKDGFVVRNADRTWGRRYAMDALGSCAIRTYRAHNRKVAPLVVGDFSHKGGGFMRGHKSHRVGVDVDTSIFVVMPAYRRALFRPNPEDVALDAQLDMLECLADTGTLELVLSDSALIQRLHARARRRWPIAKVTRVLGKVVHYPNHADHFHYRFKRR